MERSQLNRNPLKIREAEKFSVGKVKVEMNMEGKSEKEIKIAVDNSSNNSYYSVVEIVKKYESSHCK
jgi:hypothetical protein